MVGPSAGPTAAIRDSRFESRTGRALPSRRMITGVRSDLPTGTVAFLFTDVEGSTKLLHQLGAGA